MLITKKVIDRAVLRSGRNTSEEVWKLVERRIIASKQAHILPYSIIKVIKKQINAAYRAQRRGTYCSVDVRLRDGFALSEFNVAAIALISGDFTLGVHQKHY